MKRWIILGVALVSLGCSSAAPGFASFGDLQIPKDYVLLEQKDSPRGVFDEESNDIALVIPESEVEKAIPHYQPQRRGSRKLSLVLYGEPLDLDAISRSVLSGYGGGKTKLVRDEYSSHMRRHRNSDSWVVVSNTDGVERLVATCRKSGITGNIDTCDFQNNINGYGVTFHLDNENISIADEFVNFLAKKIEAWRVGAG